MFFSRCENAIRELDAKYGKACRRLSRNIVGDWQDAEECVSDAYLGAWNAIPPARPDPLFTYLCQIVRNVSLKCRRKKGAAKRGGGYAEAMEEIEIPGPDAVASAIEAKELARMIEDFLDTLTKENRVIFMRRYWFCESCREIAGRVGLTEKNVTVRLTRIRQRMREYLTEREASL